LVVILVTTLPYYLGFQNQGEHWRFTGFVFGVEDGNSYLAKMLRGSAGDWIFENFYTSQPQQDMVAYLPYLLLGKLASPPAWHVQLAVLYHIFRILAVVYLVWSTYRFIALFIKEGWLRYWAVVLIILGGGIGWAAPTLGVSGWLQWLPLSFYSPEAFGFLAVYGIPHLVLSRALLLDGFRILLKGGRFKAGLKMGLLWFALGLVQPLYLITAWGVSGLYIIGLWIFHQVTGDQPETTGGQRVQDKLIAAMWSAGVSLPVVVYYGVGLITGGDFSSWQAQNALYSPGLGEYALSYGLMLPFLAGYAWTVKRGINRREVLVVSWAAGAFIMGNFPVTFQRRLIEGAWVAVVVLACLAVSRWQNPIRGIVTWVWLLSFPATVILIWGGITAARRPAYPLFRERAETEAFLFLQANASPDEMVLSVYRTGNALPAWAPVHVVLGHPAETLNYQETARDVHRFYSASTRSAWRWGMLERYHVDYVFWGPAERELGNWNPEGATCLERIYDSQGYGIYRNICP